MQGVFYYESTHEPEQRSVLGRQICYRYFENYIRILLWIIVLVGHRRKLHATCYMMQKESLTFLIKN